MRPADPPPPTLALLAAVALDEAAAAYVPATQLRIKWPNDLLLLDARGGHAGRWAKLAGILLERVDDAVVIGFGVNLAEAPMPADRPAISLADRLGTAPDAATFLDALASCVSRWIARWRGEGLDVVRARWLSRAHSVGTPIIARTSVGDDVEGLFMGLDPAGALLLQTNETMKTIAAGDVFLL